MRILFDTQIFDWQINGGISRYFIETMHRLDRDPRTDVLMKCSHSYNTYIQDSKWLTHRPRFRNVNFKGKLSIVKSVNEKINRRYSNRVLAKKGADIFHPTYYDPYFIPRLNGIPFVLTVYDLTNERFFDNKSSTEKVMGWKKSLIRQANHIVSISENTKKDIIEFYQVAPEKITTVYLSGGFDDLHEPASGMPDLPGQFILYVGSRGGYKNFRSFVKEAAAPLLRANVGLVIAGGGPINGDEANELAKAGLSGKYLALSHVSDAVLAQLYRKALLFVFPSLYEGFGIPVLEAMQCDCPALLSNNSSLPEVGGAAGAYFDPLKEGAMEAELQRLLDSPGELARMRAMGREQVKKFNWDATAAGHIDVYKKLLS